MEHQSRLIALLCQSIASPHRSARWFASSTCSRKDRFGGDESLTWQVGRLRSTSESIKKLIRNLDSSISQTYGRSVYNRGNFWDQRVLRASVRYQTLTPLEVKLIGTRLKVVHHTRCVIFQMAEVAVPVNLFAAILARASAKARAGLIALQFRCTTIELSNVGH